MDYNSDSNTEIMELSIHPHSPVEKPTKTTTISDYRLALAEMLSPNSQSCYNLLGWVFSSRPKPVRQNSATKRRAHNGGAASVLRRAHLVLSSAASTRAPATSPLLSSSTTTTADVHLMIQYLISNCGFSPSDASKLSERLSHLASTSKPDAVLAFLRALGLDPAAIRGVVSSRPAVLATSVTKTLEPRIASLRAAGFSDAEISTLVAANPGFLYCNFLPNLQFLRAHLPSKADLFKALRRDTNLIRSNTLVPNVALLCADGVRERDIRQALITMPRLLTRNAASFKELVDRVVSLGFRPGTAMFLRALHVLNWFSKEAFQEKVELFKSLGWSEAEFNAAFLKVPLTVALSNETLRTKMRFLVEEAGLEPRDVAEHPGLLMYSLENRLVPRHRAHCILKAEGLRGSNLHLFTIVVLSEKSFFERYVLPHLGKVPALRELYPTT